MRYVDLVEDGQIPGLLVHPGWYEPRHPQEIPVDTSDAVVLWRPGSEISIPVGEFNTLPEWQAWVVSDCPAAPDIIRYFPVTTLATDAEVGSMEFSLEDFVLWESEWCVHIELDGGGWFVSKTAYGTRGTPSPQLRTLTPFAGVASAGNDVFLNAEGPLQLNGAMTYDPGA